MQDALLDGFGGDGLRDVFASVCDGELRGDFEGVVGVAAVAAGVAGDERESVVVGGERERAEAAVFIRQSSTQQGGDLLLLERLQDVDAAAREQGAR